MVQRRQQTKKARLSARDWADAALAAIGEGGGLAAVAVEPLAARLGATKGSFYWHFGSREALIEAALARWVETDTEEIIAAVEVEPDPEKRLRRLFTQVTRPAGGDPLELSLLASTDHPQVAAALRQVTERRIGYLAGLFTELGFPGDEARRRGLMAYSFYLGHTQLGHAAPSTLPSRKEFPAYLEAAMDALLRRGPRSSGHPSRTIDS
ncbi:TetR/AcrR family transcriptional regulator [Streptomyces luteolifulvus]|uniref:TetR/AcrR family transcriptional regulator n=1 Tax=Streptomyces luteolifulvus TaxID=2615112 RepID=A0A6H9UUG1_9ACTN|nr:TetR/AcrR family transcriptional regulator [Streptomyces luteolifulvus]KAB1142401.1 TetR/AcrR family transcriptional regulator [Streptomyces luteolifulvus]